MIELPETTVAMALASLGVVGTLIRSALARDGLSTLRDIRDAVERQPSHSD